MTRQRNRAEWLIKAGNVKVDRWFTFGLSLILIVSWVIAKVW